MKKTNLLIIICVLACIFYWYGYQDFVEEYLIYSGDRLQRGAFWTVITTLFVHLNPAHLIGNMIFLYVFGNVVEEEADAEKTVAIFLVGGVGSLLLSSGHYGADVLMIGASGAIFTLSATAMLIKPLKSSALFLFIPVGLVAVLYFIFNVFAVSLGFGGNVGYMTHVAGFFIGIPFGIAFSKGEWLKNLGITVLLLIAFLVIIYGINLLFGSV